MLKFTNDILIRPISLADNAAIANIIRRSLEEFGANHPGTVYFDEATDQQFEVYQTPGSCYNVVELDGRVIGGAGIYPTPGLEEDTCELVKMYLLPEGRRKGLGKKLIELCIEQARIFGYKNMFLESLPQLIQAILLYEKSGFTYLKGPLSKSGHTGCSIFMIKEI